MIENNFFLSAPSGWKWLYFSKSYCFLYAAKQKKCNRWGILRMIHHLKLVLHWLCNLELLSFLMSALSLSLEVYKAPITSRLARYCWVYESTRIERAFQSAWAIWVFHILCKKFNRKFKILSGSGQRVLYKNNFWCVAPCQSCSDFGTVWFQWVSTENKVRK